MRQSNFLRAKELFPGSKTVRVQDIYAQMARANHNLAMDFSITGAESALLQKAGCFECLSPRNITA